MMREYHPSEANCHSLSRSVQAHYPNMILIANCDLSNSHAPVDVWDYHMYVFCARNFFFGGGGRGGQGGVCVFVFKLEKRLL